MGELYTLSLKAKKISGHKGFNIYFGKCDDKNQLIWEVGGWANADSNLCSGVNGRTSCLTQQTFSLQPGIEHEFTLEVSGRQIRAWINNVLFHDTEDKLPVIEPLYYFASYERSTGDVIVKVCPAMRQMTKTRLRRLSGCRRSKRNSVRKAAVFITIFPNILLRYSE